MPQLQELNVTVDIRRSKAYILFSYEMRVGSVWVNAFGLGPSTANGAAGSQQAEVGPGFCHASRFHRALPVQAEDLPVHQADPQETRPDLRGPLCYR